MRFSGLTGSPDFWWLYLYGDRTPAFSVQVDGSICPGTGFGPYDSCNYFATLASTPQPMDQWVCYEGHFKMNTPGVANGVLEQWATNMTTGGPRIQTHGLYTRTWRGPSGANPPGCVGGGCNSSQATFSYVRLYRQNGTGERWIDDLAVGNTPIGCAGAAPLAPGTPTGTTVTKLMQQIWQWLAPAAAWAR
jgi:hypothetical protein